MRPKRRELSYAVRLPVILRYWGQLNCVTAVLTLVPLAFSAAHAEFALAGRYAVIAAVLGTGGLLLGRLRTPTRVQKNEALVVVALAFLTTPLLMSWPMMLAGTGFVGALFECVSGITTTGLTALGSVEGRSASFLFARAWMQWYGGLGVMALALAIVLAPGALAKRLALNEQNVHDPIGSTRVHFRKTATLYLLLTGAGIAVLLMLGVRPLPAVLYVFAAVSTGGYAPDDESLGAFQAVAPVLVILLLCIVASNSLASSYDIGKRGLRRMLSEPQVAALLALIALQALLLAASLRYGAGMPWREAVLHGPALAASAQTTAGFSTLDVAALDPLTKGLTMISMFVGGGAGSTAGGIKVLRLLIVLALIHSLLVRSAMPSHSVQQPRLGGTRIDVDELRNAVSVIGLAFLIVLASWLVFLAWGYPPLDSLFEVVSATGTVGLSSGVTGPELPTVLKLVLCADMLAGRLEIFAWVILFYPGTWIGRRKHETDAGTSGARR